MGDESGDEDSDMPAFSADQREWIERLVALKLAQTTDSSSRYHPCYHRSSWGYAKWYVFHSLAGGGGGGGGGRD